MNKQVDESYLKERASSSGEFRVTRKKDFQTGCPVWDLFSTHYFNEKREEIGYVIDGFNYALLLETPRVWSDEFFNNLRNVWNRT